MEADLLIADKAFDADERVVTLLAQKNKAVVMPPKEPLIKFLSLCSRKAG